MGGPADPRSPHLSYQRSQLPQKLHLKLARQDTGYPVKVELHIHKGFPGGSDGKDSACNAGELGSIPGLGRSPGEGNGNPVQCSCLENSMDRGAWLATIHGVEKSWT